LYNKNNLANWIHLRDAEGKLVLIHFGTTASEICLALWIGACSE